MVKKKKRKTFAWQPKSRFLYDLMSSAPGVIVINWVFQGVLGMDRFERAFKIALDLLFLGAFAVALSHAFDVRVALLIAFLLAHTLNWLFNGHLFVIGRFIGFTNTPPQRIWEYIKDIKDRTGKKSFLSGVIVFGAVSRAEGVRNTSDIDIRFIREQGFWNGLSACYYGLYERSRALFSGFPLDLYVYDNVLSLDRLRKDEQPLILYDPKGTLKEKYKERGFRLV